MKTVLRDDIANGTYIEKNNCGDTKRDKEKKEKSSLHSMEILLKRACVIILALLTISQAVLSLPSVRTAFFFEGTDGDPLGSEAYVFTPCKMELSLTDMGECPELKILVNGEIADTFQGKSVLLDLKNGDVVELDASDVLVLPTVKISAASRNIEAVLGKSITAAGGLVPVATVNTGN